MTPTPQDTAAELERARAALAALLEAQVPARAAALAPFDAEALPLRDRVAAAEEAHAQAVAAEVDRRRRVLTPWTRPTANPGYEALGPLYGARRWLAHEAGKWYTLRAWLRLVTRDGRAVADQWEAQVFRSPAPDAAREDVVFGPPSGDPAADLARLQAEVDRLLVERGFILPEGEARP